MVEIGGQTPVGIVTIGGQTPVGIVVIGGQVAGVVGTVSTVGTSVGAAVGASVGAAVAAVVGSAVTDAVGLSVLLSVVPISGIPGLKDISPINMRIIKRIARTALCILLSSHQE